MPQRIAYMPLNTYPEAAPDPAVVAAIGLASAIGSGLQVSTFAVDIPPVASPLGAYFLNVDGMVRAAENRSAAECERLRTLVAEAAPPGFAVRIATHRPLWGSAPNAAVAEARYFDVAVMPWAPGPPSAEDMAQALVFGAGVPVILVPPTAIAAPLDHIAVAWDESRVATRALCDALPLLAPGGRVSVLTVTGDKALSGSGVAATLAAALHRRGYEATAVDLGLEGRQIGETLQQAALAAGAQLLAMGGFGHSRLRDFILGGATKGVFAELRLPVLLAH